jgi:cytochrome c-type protein NapC
MTGNTTILVAVILFSIVLIALLVLRPSITATRAGKILAFVALLVFPLLAGGMGVNQHMERSKSTNFCLSCHVMEDYGKSLHVDDRSFIPATHFQYNLVPRDKACYTCHTDYTMYGDINSKLRGLKHVYAYYIGKPSQPIKLYQPYNNRECLHCHLGARSFEESEAHTKDPPRL